jgi:hypothetical protein
MNDELLELRERETFLIERKKEINNPEHIKTIKSILKEIGNRKKNKNY